MEITTSNFYLSSFYDSKRYNSSSNTSNVFFSISSIAQVAKALEDNQKLLGFMHFSLECDTLERVFLDLCSRADNKSMSNGANMNNADKANHIG